MGYVIFFDLWQIEHNKLHMVPGCGAYERRNTGATTTKWSKVYGNRVSARASTNRPFQDCKKCFK